MSSKPSIIVFNDRKYHFQEMFDSNTGFYVRSGILEKSRDTNKSIDTGIDPFMRCMPFLIDIGIMGQCEHGGKGLCTLAGVECYQNGLNKKQPNMSLANFKLIVNQIKGKTFQCALGGRGDPNKHQNFAEILQNCRDNHIVPNYTTSGFGLTDDEVAITKEYVGAVAVSFYRHLHTYRALDKFISNGIKTNIHYVLSNNSIDEAIERLTDNAFPERVNAIIFLLHKPVGLGSINLMLNPNDERVKRFFALIDTHQFPFKIGFDSCSVAGVLNYSNNIDRQTIEACEGGRFSCYISPDMKLLPCSFDQSMKYAIDLTQSSIEEGWNSDKFHQFRNFLRLSCVSCFDRNECMGGCPLVPQITLCNRTTKQQEVGS
jgi:radical SAM protein with 4Fe4S-binding SPASM domain